MTINPAQVRAGRALIDWSQKELARYCHLSIDTMKNIERGQRVISDKSERAIRAALESNGVIFIEHGVALQNPSHDAPSNLERTALSSSIV